MSIIVILLLVVASGWYWLHKHESELVRVRGELLVLQTVYERLKAKIDP